MKCEECKFAEPFIDPFNQKQRLYCGKGLQIIDNFGDSMLITSEYMTDCEHGEPIEETKMKNCEWYVSDIRWTDKLSVTCDGDIIDFNGRVVGHINLMIGGAE